MELNFGSIVLHDHWNWFRLPKIHDTDSNCGGPLSDVQIFGVLGCGYDKKYNSRIGSCKHHAYGDKSYR